MANRVSGAQRIESWNVAERAIMKYAGNHKRWHKFVHNVELDTVQKLKCVEMDKHRMTLDFSSRRMGKTAIKELYYLMFLATHADQALGIVAPREAQAMVNMAYHQDAIRRSPILSAFINVKQGRRQIADTYYQFANRSEVSCDGIMANVDGGDLTLASLEEVDDMPKDRLFSRYLLQMGSNRRLGASKKSKNEAQIRITGVFKGADTLSGMIDSGEYHVIAAMTGKKRASFIRKLIAEGWLAPNVINPEQYRYPLPVGNAVIGMGMLDSTGRTLLNREFLTAMRKQLGEAEFTRQLLCLNTSSRNLIWEAWLQRAVQLGLEAEIEPVIPLPGMTYRKRGRVAFGYDHTGHGEQPESSKSGLVVTEDVSGFVVPIFAKQWPLGTDESAIKRDIISFWRFFMPDAAMGDSFGVGLIGDVCDELYAQGLTTINRLDNPTTASHWHEWPFAPVRFEGTVKHSMAVSLASAFSSGRVALPYVNDIRESDVDFKDVEDLQIMYKQLVNIKDIPTSKTYSSYQMVKKIIGDDLFDAGIVSHWALKSGGLDVVTQILLGSVSKQQLMID